MGIRKHITAIAVAAAIGAPLAANAGDAQPSGDSAASQTTATGNLLSMDLAFRPNERATLLGYAFGAFGRDHGSHTTLEPHAATQRGRRAADHSQEYTLLRRGPVAANRGTQAQPIGTTAFSSDLVATSLVRSARDGVFNRLPPDAVRVAGGDHRDAPDHSTDAQSRLIVRVEQ